MKNNTSGLLTYLFAFGLLFIGLGVVYYAYELVSVPQAQEYREGWVIIIGLILAAVGTGLGVHKFRAARHRSEAPDVIESQAG